MHRIMWGAGALALCFTVATTGCAQGSLTPGSSDATTGNGSGGASSATTTGTGGGATTTGTGGATTSTTSSTTATTGGTGGATTSTTTTTSGTGGGAAGSGGAGGEAPHPCGDGMIGPGEDCDGANLGGKTCVALGFAGGTLTCTGQCALDTLKCDACHNGQIQPNLGEECDFDAMNQPLILATCQSLGFMSPNNPGCDPSCHYDVTPCLCGDAIIDPGEQCDGANLGGKACTDEGFSGGVLACTPGCAFDFAGCTSCGNGMIEPGEQCDGADLGGQTCVTKGFSGGALACSPGCQFLVGGCTTCGNGIIEAPEQCDGLNLGGKTCATQGFTGGVLSCSPQCGLSTAGCTLCGNGVKEPGEGCDDGNAMSGDGCSAACQVEVLACDPDGNYAVIMGGPIAYTCCGGLVNVNIASFVLSNDGASILSSPSNPATMHGAATTCPAGNFANSGSIPGGCTETYAVSGSFTGPNTWTGVYSMTFTGGSCDCFGGLLGTPCVNQVFPIAAMR